MYDPFNGLLGFALDKKLDAGTKTFVIRIELLFAELPYFYLRTGQLLWGGGQSARSLTFYGFFCPLDHLGHYFVYLLK